MGYYDQDERIGKETEQRRDREVVLTERRARYTTEEWEFLQSFIVDDAEKDKTIMGCLVEVNLDDIKNMVVVLVKAAPSKLKEKFGLLSEGSLAGKAVSKLKPGEKSEYRDQEGQKHTAELVAIIESDRVSVRSRFGVI